MKKLLEQAMVSKDAPKVKSGLPRKEKKMGGAPTGRKESGRFAEEEEAKQETGSKAESELESVSDSESEVGKSQ